MFRLRCAFIYLFALTFLLQFLPTAVYAAGETFAWVNSSTIKASGGDLNASVDLKGNGSGGFGGKMVHESGCEMTIVVGSINDAKTEGFLSANNEFLSEDGGPQPCSDSLRDSYTRSVMLQNPENAGGSGSETADSRRVRGSSHPITNMEEGEEYDVASAPPSDEITLKRAGSGDTIKTIPSEGPTVAGGFLAYNFAIEDVDAGDYTACSKLANNCVNFTKQFDISPNPLIIPGKNTAINLEVVSGATTTTCDAGPGLTWIVCNTVKFFQGVIDLAKDFIVSYLNTKPLPTDGDMFGAWKNLRNLANILLVPIFFALIFAQTLSLNLDAYAVKKMLPKLIAGAILIQFSYYIVSIAVDISNVIGNGLGNLMTAAFSSGSVLNINLTHPGSFLEGLTIGAIIIVGVSAAFVGAVFVFLIPLLLAILAVLLTLVFRQVLIVVLAMLAPIAFAAWILPNTEPLFKLWWSTFIRTLAMYPLITALFAAGTIAASILSNNPISTDPTFSGNLSDLAAIVALIVPLALVPFTFKFGGTALGALSGSINKARSNFAGEKGLGGRWNQKWRNKAKGAYKNIQTGRIGTKIPFSGGKELRAAPDSLLGRATSRLAQPWRRRATIDAAMTKGMGAATEEASKELKADFADAVPVAQMILGGRKRYEAMVKGKTGQEKRNLDAIWKIASKHTTSLPHISAAAQVLGQAKQVDADTYKDVSEKLRGLPMGDKIWKDMALGSIDKNPHLMKVDFASGQIGQRDAAKALAGAGIDKAKDFSVDAIAHALRDKYELDGGGNQTLSDTTLRTLAADSRTSENVRTLIETAMTHAGKGGRFDDLINASYTDPATGSPVLYAETLGMKTATDPTTGSKTGAHFFEYKP